MKDIDGAKKDVVQGIHKSTTSRSEGGESLSVASSEKKYFGVSRLQTDFMILSLILEFTSLYPPPIPHHNVSNTPANGLKLIPNHHRVPPRLNSPPSNPQITCRGNTNRHQRSIIVFSTNQME